MSELLEVALMFVLGIVFHEAAHAVAAKHHGVAKAVGFGVARGWKGLFIWGPCVVADVDSDSALKRRIATAPLYLGFPGMVAVLLEIEILIGAFGIGVMMTFLSDIPSLLFDSFGMGPGDRLWQLYTFKNEGWSSQ